MKTEDLIGLLAADAIPVRRHAASRRLALALAAGLPLAGVVMALLGYGVRDDLGQVVALPMFWMKLLFPAVLCAAAVVTLQRLARPGVKAGSAWIGIAGPLLALWVMAAVTLAQAPAELRLALVLGQTWRTCSASIAVISLPVFGSVFAALSGLAPTRPALAGACAGLVAGAAGAAIYALHCPELAAPFLAVWYVGGIAVPTAAGALLGPRLLRW
ncbi:MAG: NrsF family protein [Ramlibacter sp.]